MTQQVKNKFQYVFGNIEYQRENFALSLAYAVTAHKAQGETLQEVIIDPKLPLVHQKLTKSTHPLRVEFICKPTNTESSIFTERSEPNVLFITLNVELMFGTCSLREPIEP